MYFRTQRVTHCLFELEVHLVSYDHGLLKLFDILKGLPPKHLANCHDATDEGAAGFPSSGDSPRQRAGRLKRSRIPQIKLFLQSCKNELTSTGIFQSISESGLSNLFDDPFSFVIHRQLPFSTEANRFDFLIKTCTLV